MKQQLCCTLNTYAVCSLCGEKWCNTCWNKIDGTHHDGSNFYPCPLAQVVVQWGPATRGVDGYLPHTLVAKE